MPAEELTGRRTPYEVVFGVEALAEERFPTIAEEAKRSSVDVSRRDHFALLAEVGSLLQLLIPEELDPATVDQYVDIVFHCFHFWSAGCPLYAFEDDLVRDLIERPPDLAGWQVQTPRASLYLELPRQLLWAAVADGQPPEPAEGIFARLDASQGGPARADLLLVLGMRPDRPGFSVAGMSVDLASEPFCDDSAFRSDLPGAELAGIYSLGRPVEVTILARRMLWYLARYPSAMVLSSPASTAPAVAGDDRTTALDHRRVRRVERVRG